jgi:OOP family OmpA-OmpF porin
MNQPRPSNQPPSPDTAASPQLKQEWAELRTLLLAPEQTQLTELRNRIDHTKTDAPSVSKVLAEAITLRGKQDERLTAALTPHVQTALTSSVRRNPHVIAEAIAPIMGPAIRQAIVRTLQGMMQSFNQTIDHSLSPKGLAWRIEAWRTGRPFAEVVLLHTLRFRVEQLFLIHRDTGLLLHHVASDTAVIHDQQLVSGMLTAIQAFVQDTFSTPRGQTLNTLEVGECRVLIEQDSQAILACVVRGTAPGYLRAQVQQTLESIQLDYADAFAAFDGNPSGFDATHDRLMECVQTQYETPRTKTSPMTWVAISVIVLSTAVWGWTSYQGNQRWQHLTQRIRTMPGVVVTTLERDGQTVTLEGLRDPLATDPAELLADEGIPREHIISHWTPFHSLDPEFVGQRATSLLHPPGTATLHYDDGRLTASGTAPESWAVRAKQLAPLLPGVREYHDTDLRTVSRADLITQLNRVSFFFESGSSTLSESELDKITPVKHLLEDLRQSTFSSSGGTLVVEAIGDADPAGPETMNFLLATARAHVVIAALGGAASYPPLTFSASVEPTSFAGQKRGVTKSNQNAQRRVTILVTHKNVPGRADSTP